MVRVGSCDVHVDTFRRLVAWHGPEALRLPAGGACPVGWSLRQAALRALAAPPRVGGRWGDIDVRGPEGGPWTLLFKGELARFAETVLSGDVNVTVTAGAGRVTAFAVLTRREHPAAPTDDETEVRR